MSDTDFSSSKPFFHDRLLPEAEAKFAGYAALIEGNNLRVPLPKRLSIISSKHKKYQTPEWSVYTPRHEPSSSLEGQLTFALKYEGIDLAILNALFKKLSPNIIEKIVQKEPTGQYSRRIWFLYEWLTGQTLKLPDCAAGSYVDIINTKLQYGASSEKSSRHRINNNLPGTPNFCPLIQKTEKLEKFISQNLKKSAAEAIGKMPKDIILRAAAFLLLSDSKSSFHIEGESPSFNRAERWAKMIGAAGKYPLTEELFLTLQQTLIKDSRFINLGYRKQEGFIGMHDRSTGEPIPDYISARHEDLPILIEGLIACDKKLSLNSLDPILHAAVIAFGFVLIHPLEDGNGRIHRYLLHHVLSTRQFTPKGFIFPISSVILDRVLEYKNVLESFSLSRLELIEWSPSRKGNVEIHNETIDLYRYFDATGFAEFLYECVAETVHKALPNETEYLIKYDKMKSFLTQHFDIPENKISLLVQFLEQNKGKLSQRARSKEFAALTESESELIEEMFKETFLS